MNTHSHKAVMSTCIFALAFVAALLIQENHHKSELFAVVEAAQLTAKAEGYNLAKVEVADHIKKQVTDSVCTAWWFGGNTQRVGEAIKKVKLQ